MGAISLASDATRAPQPAPLVLLAGTLCDPRVFAPLLARLDGREALTPSLTGAACAETLAEQILRRLPERFALLGFSLGGVVALEVALRAPERVAGLALLSTNPRPPPPDTLAHRREQPRLARDGGVRAHVEQTLWPAYVAPGRSGDANLKEAVLAMAEAVGCDAYADQVEVALTRRDRRPRLGRIHMPALVVSAELDTVCPPALGAELAGAFLACEHVCVPGAGHFALLETPDAVASPVQAWLARVDAASAPLRNPQRLDAR